MRPDHPETAARALPERLEAVSTDRPAVREFRVWGEGGTFRVFYTVKTADAVYILHAFQKKAQQTPQKDIDLAIKRYREIGR